MKKDSVVVAIRGVCPSYYAFIYQKSNKTRLTARDLQFSTIVVNIIHLLYISKCL